MQMTTYYRQKFNESNIKIKRKQFDIIDVINAKFKSRRKRFNHIDKIMYRHPNVVD